MAEFFIKQAIKHPGALMKKAKAMGETAQEFCARKHDDTTTQRQCSLAKTLRGFQKR